MKEYIIRMSRKDGNKILDLAFSVIQMEQIKPEDVPDKFIQASLAVAVRFQVGKELVYKMTEKHLMGVLDSIGGFYMAAQSLADIHSDRSALPTARMFMKLANKIEAQAVTQGFKPDQYQPAPPTPEERRKALSLIQGGKSL